MEDIAGGLEVVLAPFKLTLQGVFSVASHLCTTVTIITFALIAFYADVRDDSIDSSILFFSCPAPQKAG